MQFRSLDGGDWPRVHGELRLVIALHYRRASPADFEHLAGRWRWLKVLRLRLWFWSLRNVSVPVVELEISGKGNGQVGAFRLHDEKVSTQSERGSNSLFVCQVGSRSQSQRFCKGAEKQLKQSSNQYVNLVQDQSVRQWLQIMQGGG
jgi:hypothetical protein